MKWREVKITVNKEVAEATANILLEAGANGLQYDEDESRTTLIAYFPENQNDSLANQITQKINSLQSYGLNPGQIKLVQHIIPEENWANSWHRFFHPSPLGKDFIVYPSWDKPDKTDRILLEIDPGMAFGIGSHETTRLSVELLEKYIPATGYKKMLDIGTGTGILSIVAAKLGVPGILGLDIDEAAVETAINNVKKNGVFKQVDIKKGDLLKDVSGKYPLIAGNLLPHLIRRLIPFLPNVVMEGSLVILSGIIKEKRNLIYSDLLARDFKLIEERHLNEWVSMVVRKG